MTIDLKLIHDLSLKEKKSMLERFLKLSEECGELAQEILISENASGFQHKQMGDDGIRGEAVDVAIVAFSIFFKNGGTMDELGDLFLRKCEKWQKWQK